MAEFIGLVQDVLGIRLATFGFVDITLGWLAGGYLVYQFGVYYFDYVARHPSNHGLDDRARSLGYRDHAEHQSYDRYFGGSNWDE